MEVMKRARADASPIMYGHRAHLFVSGPAIKFGDPRKDRVNTEDKSLEPDQIGGIERRIS